MKKKNFIEEVEKAEIIAPEKLAEIEKRLIKEEPKIHTKRGTRHLVIAIEELSELQKALTKYLRGIEVSGNDILEEVADVYVCLDLIQNIVGLDLGTVQKAVSVKLKRAEKNLNKALKTGEQCL